MKTRLPFLLPLFALAACAESVPPDASASNDPSVRPPKAGLCVACHGPYGVTNLPGTPHIAGQDETYLRESMLKYRSGARPHAPMKAAVGGLSDADIAQLARYYAQLPRDGLGPMENR